MQPQASVFIFGPDEGFNSALIVELGRRQIAAQVAANDVDTLRGMARAVPLPEVVFLDCQFGAGWGLDLLYALIKLFPKSLIFVSAKSFTLNRCALEELGVQCFVNRESGLPVIVNHLLECHKEFKSKNSNVS